MAFFLLCLFCFAAGTWAVKDYKTRRDSWILAIIGFIVGYGVEYWGVSTGGWEYYETDMFFISDIPFEILVGYATGMFLLGLLIHYVANNHYDNDGALILKFFPVIGAFFISVSILHGEVPLYVGLSFLALWGLMISKKQSIPILVGICTFFADLILEGFLYTFTNYYDWNVGVAAAFMLVGVFIAGVLTRKQCGKDDDFCFVVG